MRRWYIYLLKVWILATCTWGHYILKIVIFWQISLFQIWSENFEQAVPGGGCTGKSGWRNGMPKKPNKYRRDDTNASMRLRSRTESPLRWKREGVWSRSELGQRWYADRRNTTHATTLSSFIGRGSTFGAGIGGGAGTRRALEVWKDIEAMFLIFSVMLGRQLLSVWVCVWDGRAKNKEWRRVIYRDCVGSLLLNLYGALDFISCAKKTVGHSYKSMIFI